MKSERVLHIISIICLLVAVCMLLSLKYKISDIKNPKTFKVIAGLNSNKESGSEIKIDYNFPIMLSGKTKDEIYQIRKEYVEKSIFSGEHYEPSEEVFGGIEDNKPWISLDICKETKSGIAKTSGPSEEARYIVNPTILVSLEYPFLFDYDNEKWCNDVTNDMLPVHISYNDLKNEITVIYSKLPFYTRKQDFYHFNGLNARDMGYRYAYIDILKSKYLPKFKNSNNISSTIVEFLNFIHTGYSCKVEGGCNNGSPRQDYLEFEYPAKKHVTNATIYIKLWKNKPLYRFQKADMTEKIIIEDL